MFQYLLQNLLETKLTVAMEAVIEHDIVVRKIISKSRNIFLDNKKSPRVFILTF